MRCARRPRPPSLRRRIVALAAALGVAGCSGPALLNGVDRLYGAGDATRAAEGVAFGAHGQRLDLWTPPGATAGARPVVVFFHGGSWSTGRRQEYGFAGRALARQGYVTIVADYRKSPQFRFPSFVHDAADAVAWTHANVARFGGDPARIAVMGHSAGAHLAVMVALDPTYLDKAGAPADAIKAVVGLSGPYDFLPITSPAAKVALGGWPDQAATQPITYARAGAPPMLLINGAADTLVRPRNAEALGAALAAKGGQATVRIYPGVDHNKPVMALSRPFAGKAPVLADTRAFLDATLR